MLHRELFQVVQGRNKSESADSVMMQELLLGGHLYQKIFKEYLENWMYNLKLNLNKKLSTNLHTLREVSMQIHNDLALHPMRTPQKTNAQIKRLANRRA